MAKVAKQLSLVQLQALISNVPKYCPNMTIALNSQPYTTAQLVSLLTGVHDAFTAATAAKAAWKGAVVAAQGVGATQGVLARELRDICALMFINAPATLNDLGITPRKAPKPLTGAARAAATAKMEATRKARGTTSKKQKALADTHDPREGLGMVELRAVA